VPDLTTRRSFLFGAACLAAATLTGCTTRSSRTTTVRSPSTPTTSGTPATPLVPVDCAATEAAGGAEPLWQTAVKRGLVYGSSTATWQISDPAYRKLYEQEVAILFTEDDMLWYRVRPSPTSGLKFQYPDQIVSFAEKNKLLIFGTHLVWDDGFGTGWNQSDLNNMDKQTAEKYLWGTLDALVTRYKGRVTAWSTVNEAVDAFGLRSDVPWYQSIGPSYVAEAFQRAHAADPNALLVLNEYGFETTDGFTDPVDKRAATLTVLDQLLADKVPVHALGIQAHLDATYFPDKFNEKAYRQFLADVAGRGLRILVTEMDVLDDTLPPAAGPRDKAVANIYRRYLDVALDEPDVISLMTFGLSDRYTWLQEDYPRNDGAPRRPLPFDQKLKPKPALSALEGALSGAAQRNLYWKPPRC